MTASPDVAVGVPARLVEGQVAIPDPQFHSLIFLFRILPAVRPGRCVLVQMGVRVEPEHHVATVNLSENQLSVPVDASGLTQQEDHCYAMTHFRDGFLLARDIDRRHEMGTRRVIIFRIGAENKMVH